MGQGEILNLLKEKGTLTEKQIAQILECTISSAAVCLRKLYKQKDIKREKVNTINKQGKEIHVKCYLFQINLDNGKKTK